MADEPRPALLADMCQLSANGPAWPALSRAARARRSSHHAARGSASSTVPAGSSRRAVRMAASTSRTRVDCPLLAGRAARRTPPCASARRSSPTHDGAEDRSSRQKGRQHTI
eukprot:scaffold176380_cov28-Tisochrysis_lutea.AAC.4